MTCTVHTYTISYFTQFLVLISSGWNLLLYFICCSFLSYNFSLRNAHVWWFTLFVFRVWLACKPRQCHESAIPQPWARLYNSDKASHWAQRSSLLFCTWASQPTRDRALRIVYDCVWLLWRMSVTVTNWIVFLLSVWILSNINNSSYLRICVHIYFAQWMYI